MADIKSALIVGVSGQDGFYLSQNLLSKGIKVYGTSRNKITCKSQHGDVETQVELIQLDPFSYSDVYQLIQKIRPYYIFNLGCQSSVGISFTSPYQTINSIVTPLSNILESIRNLKINARFFSAGSGEVYGETKVNGATEKSVHTPKSPYGLGKSIGQSLVKLYRDQYGIFACTGILFNHESHRRSLNFVTRKIITHVHAVKNSSFSVLKLGNLDVTRDFGWAPEYVEAMYMMLDAGSPQDYVIGSGYGFTLKSFLMKSYEYVGLNWENFVELDLSISRPSDIKYSVSNPKKISDELGWKAKVFGDQLVIKLLEPMR